jgi:hypothetical protein
MDPTDYSCSPRVQTVPPHTVFGVFERDAAMPKLVADLVGPREISGCPRSLAFGDQTLHLVSQPRLLGAHHVEVRIDVINQVEELLAHGLVHPAVVEGSVGLADELEQQSNPLRQVEVVVKSVAITRADLGDPSQQLPVVPGRRS